MEHDSMELRSKKYGISLSVDKEHFKDVEIVFIKKDYDGDRVESSAINLNGLLDMQGKIDSSVSDRLLEIHNRYEIEKKKLWDDIRSLEKKLQEVRTENEALRTVLTSKFTKVEQ